MGRGRRRGQSVELHLQRQRNRHRRAGGRPRGGAVVMVAVPASIMLPRYMGRSNAADAAVPNAEGMGNQQFQSV